MQLFFILNKFKSMCSPYSKLTLILFVVYNRLRGEITEGVDQNCSYRVPLVNNCCFIAPEGFCMRLNWKKIDIGIVSWNTQKHSKLPQNCNTHTHTKKDVDLIYCSPTDAKQWRALQCHLHHRLTTEQHDRQKNDTHPRNAVSLLKIQCKPRQQYCDTHIT